MNSQEVNRPYPAVQEMVKWFGDRLVPLVKTDLEVNLKKNNKYFSNVDKKISIHPFYIPVSTGISEGILLVPEHTTTLCSAFALHLHALGEDCLAEHWQWMQKLLDSGISIFSFNLDGHSLFSKTYFDPSMVTRTIPIILNRLFSNIDNSNFIPKCFLVGSEFGATLSLIAGTNSELKKWITGVIAVNPLLSISEQELLQFHPKKNKKSMQMISKIFNIFPKKTKEILSVKPLTSIRCNMALPVHLQINGFIIESFMQRRILKNMVVPILWIHDIHEKRSPYAHSAKMMSEVNSVLFSHAVDRLNHKSLQNNSEIHKYIAYFAYMCMEYNN